MYFRVAYSIAERILNEGRRQQIYVTWVLDLQFDKR